MNGFLTSASRRVRTAPVVSAGGTLGLGRPWPTVNGIFRPIALVAGRAVATWTMPAGKVVLAPFGPLSPETETALQARADDIQRFLPTAATAADGPDLARRRADSARGGACRAP
jgi:hypothetical protein